MAKHSNGGKAGGRSPEAAAKGSERDGRDPAAPAAAGNAPVVPARGWAHRHAGTLYITGAFAVVVLIAVFRAGCN
ncbi:MAG: hypothetical protein GYA57_04740 [Myxococcales bacterium]|nr:hypothetical protein [Myxococcales bacterium]